MKKWEERYRDKMDLESDKNGEKEVKSSEKIEILKGAKR